MGYLTTFKCPRTKKSWWQVNPKFLITTVAGLITAFLTFVLGPSVSELIKNRENPDLAANQSPILITSTPTEPVQVFGPASGKLNHNANDLTPLRLANQNLLNFTVEAQFRNPYDSSEHAWDYGFSFRRTVESDAYRIFVNSNKHWFLQLSQVKNGKPQIQTIADDELENLNVTSGQVNVLRLVVKDNVAEFFVNNSLIKTLGVGAKVESGDIGIGTGYLPGDEVDGKSTHYEGFIIYP